MTKTEQIEKVLKLTASHIVHVESKPNYNDDALVDASIIFSHVVMDKMYDLMNYDGLPTEQRLDMAESCGNEIRKIIKTYTGLDSIKLADEYGK